MSYTTHVRDSFTYSYTVTESVGDGQTRSRTITETEPIDIYVHVDTDPFDRSVDNCTGTVKGMTGAVVAFQTADIASRKINSKNICTATSHGFYKLIDSNLNMRNVSSNANVQALSIELLKQKQELIHKQEVMEKDYHRIGSRYAKIFDDLNHEFSLRIHNLMKPCFQFVENSKNVATIGSFSGLVTTPILDNLESAKSRVAIAISYVKNNALTLINSAQSFLKIQKKLNYMMEAMQHSEEVNGEQIYYVPALCLTASTDKSAPQKHVYVCDELKQSEVFKTIQKEVKHIKKTQPLNQEEQKRIEGSFFQQLEELNQNPNNERVVQKIKELYSKH